MTKKKTKLDYQLTFHKAEQKATQKEYQEKFEELVQEHALLQREARRFLRSLNSCWIQGSSDPTLKEYLEARVSLFDLVFKE